MRWLAANWQQMIPLAGDHVALAIPAILVSIVIAIPLGRLAQRHGWVGRPLLGLATLMYAVPALPMLIVIPAILGFPLRSPATMITALSVYGVALLVRTAADGFASVDVGVHDAAVAVGHSRRSVFFRVDLPLALPVIFAGIRVVVVSTVGLVTIGALLGQSSLGTLLTDGFQRGIAAEVIAGVVLTIAVAVALDGLVQLTARAVTPWTRAAVSGRAGATS